MKKLVHWMLAISACLPLASQAQAPAWPDRPIKFILPFPAGSATDGVARFIAEELRKSLGQTIVIDNQAGADGIVAAQAVKRAAPDGYTYFMSTNSAHGTNKALYSNLPYDPEKDFEPVAGLISIPLTVLVRKDFPADDIQSFMKAGAQRPAGKGLSFGSGNTSSLVGAHLVRAAGKFDVVVANYKGTPQALQDLVGGQIDAAVIDPYSSMALVQGGQLKALAVTDTVRHPLLPQVPTLAEAGYKGITLLTWAALFAPAKTDPAIVERMNREINKILARPESKESLLKMAMNPMVMTPGELRTFVGAELTRWGQYVELASIPRK